MRGRLILGGLALASLAGGLFTAMAGGRALLLATIALLVIGGAGLPASRYLPTISALNTATRKHLANNPGLRRIGLVAAFPLLMIVAGAGLGALSRYMEAEIAVACFVAGLTLLLAGIAWSTVLRLAELRILNAIHALQSDA